MKYLNKKATEIMRKLCDDVTDHKIISKPDYMPVNIEVIGSTDKINGISRIIAVAHTYIQNDDIMRDPEMVFIEVITEDDEYFYIPISYEQSNLGIYEISVKLDDGIKINPSLQNKHKNFANQWMQNIKHQQNL